MRTELVDSGRALVGEHATEILSLKSSYKLGCLNELSSKEYTSCCVERLHFWLTWRGVFKVITELLRTLSLVFM